MMRKDRSDRQRIIVVDSAMGSELTWFMWCGWCLRIESNCVT